MALYINYTFTHNYNFTIYYSSCIKHSENRYIRYCLMGKISFCLTLGILLLLAIISLRTVLIFDYQQNVIPCSPQEGTDYISVNSSHLKRFQEAIKVPSISYSIHNSNRTALKMLLDQIKISYPVIHSSPFVTMESFNLSTLYIVKGTENSVKPILLAGHIDVVPAKFEKWSFSPFSGYNDGLAIFGRGTLDNKNTVFGILEALEHFLQSGKQPKRSIFIAIGHDEEVAGHYGAKAITKELEKRKIRFSFMMDEGCPVLQKGSFPGYDGPVGLVCTAEKGYLTMKLSVEHTGGHASTPPKEGGAINIISDAIQRLHNNPLPSLFGEGVEVPMFEHAAKSQSFIFRVISSNLWFFGPVLSMIMSLKDATRAQITTTFAFTQISGGIKENVLPNSASVIINCRPLPGHSIHSVIDHVSRVINNPKIRIDILDEKEPSLISSTVSEGYNVIHHTIKQIFPESIVVPGLLIGGTDSKYYGDLCDDVYRFAPSYLKPDDIKRIHGHDEMITIKNYEQTINFFHHLLVNVGNSFEHFPSHDEL